MFKSFCQAFSLKKFKLLGFCCVAVIILSGCSRDDSYENSPYRAPARRARPAQYQQYQQPQYHNQYPAYAPAYPNSRAYRNPYDYSPYGGYQDYEEYYVPPVEYRNSYDQMQNNRGDKS